MSFRVGFQPIRYPEFYDWLVPENATEQVLKEVADKCVWHQPLKLFGKRDDPRMIQLLAILNDEYSMTEDNLKVVELTR